MTVATSNISRMVLAISKKEGHFFLAQSGYYLPPCRPVRGKRGEKDFCIFKSVDGMGEEFLCIVFGQTQTFYTVDDTVY